MGMKTFWILFLIIFFWVPFSVAEEQIVNEKSQTFEIQPSERQEDTVLKTEIQSVIEDSKTNENELSSKQNISSEIELQIEDRYSYNESEDVDNFKYIKTKYDFNMGESQMSVGIKGVSIKFPVSKSK